MKAKTLLFSLLTISSSIAIGQNDNDNFLVSAKGQQGWGFINLKGEWVIKPQYQSVGEFASNGLANVDVDYDKSGFIDKTGKMVIEPIFEGAWQFSNGLACIYENRKRGAP